ncbi:MAG: hypothetical protein LBU32_21410 [Clostridiales bacterium]|nr:hypothetical protein [Clostridiales bacterium]
MHEEALERELKTLKEERKKSVVRLYGTGMAPESISTVLGIPITEVLTNLVEYLAANPKDSEQSS